MPYILVLEPAWQMKLTPKEQEILLLLVGEGLSTDEAGERLVVTASTVRSHVASLQRKFGAKSRTQLAANAIESGVLALRPDTL